MTKLFLRKKFDLFVVSKRETVSRLDTTEFLDWKRLRVETETEMNFVDIKLRREDTQMTYSLRLVLIDRRQHCNFKLNAENAA